MSDPKRPVDELFPTLKSWREEFTPGEFIPRHKSKDMIVYMSPDEFLDMAFPIESMDDLRYFGPFTGEKSIDAIHEITRLIRGGTEMDEVPKLGIDASDGRVQNHDGRHRANALKKLGYEKMPVRIQSLSSGGGVRWSEQRDPSLFGYNEDLPTQLISEDGTKTMGAPWETEGPNRGLPRAEYASAQPRDLPTQLLEESIPSTGARTMATPLQKQLSDLFTLHDEQAAEVRRLRSELADLRPEDRRGYLSRQGDLEYDLEHAQKDLAKTQERLRASYASAQEGRARSFRELEERYASTVAEPFIEEEVFGHEMETRRQEGQLRRGERAAGGRAARAARPSLDDLLQSEGIPRESFVDFVEIPENRRSGKSIPQLIQDYKIAGDLPGSAGVPEGRSPRLYPPMTGEPTIHPPWEPDPHNISSGPSRENYRSVTPPEMTSQQKAFIAQDPESGLNIFTPTEVEAQWEGRPLSDDDLLMRGIDPQSPTGPQDEWNLMYGGDEGFDVEKGFEKSRLGPQDEFSLMYGGDEGFDVEEGFEDLMRGLEPEEAEQFGRSSRGALDPAFGMSDAEYQRTINPELLEGAPRRPSSGGTEAAQGVLRGTAELEPDRVTMNVDRPVLRSTTGATGFDPTSAPRAGQIGPRLPLSQKFIGSAEQVRDILANPDIKAKIAPGKLSRLERFALKAGPVLHAAGNVALAAELGYFVGKERDLGGGLMAMGASNVEGTGALMQFPQAGVEAARSAFVPEEFQDLPLPGEIATQGLAAAGRGLQSSVGAYRREEDRGDRRVHYERQKAFYRELEPTLSEDQIREMAMRDVSGASTQEAIDDLQRRVSDRDVMMDGFPAQSGMIAEGMRRRSLYPEGAGLATELITPKRR